MLSVYAGKRISREEGNPSLIPSSIGVADCVRVSVDCAIETLTSGMLSRAAAVFDVVVDSG